MITQQDVEEYRDIYYEHLKPMLKQGLNSKEIEEALLPVVVLHNWTMEKFQAFQMIDLMQRIEYMKDSLRLQGKKANVELRLGNEEMNTVDSYKVPELRCPIRSEEKRNLN